jgi:hypothetical protein
MKEILDFAREHPVWTFMYLLLISGAVGSFLRGAAEVIRRR